MRVKNWDYRELRERIADGYTLRHFTQFNGERVPKHDAFHRAFNRLTPETLQAVNDAVIRAAVDLGLEDGTKLRVDTTVVETDIHYPTDSTLLWDSVRVLTRLVGHLAARLPAGVGYFPNRTRRARRRMHEIHRLAPRQRPRHQGTEVSRPHPSGRAGGPRGPGGRRTDPRRARAGPHRGASIGDRAALRARRPSHPSGPPARPAGRAGPDGGEALLGV